MYLLVWSYFNTSYSVEEFIADGESLLDSYSPDELAAAWQEFEQFEIRTKNRPGFLVDQQFANEQLIKCGIAGAVLLVLMGVCFWLWWSLPRPETKRSDAQANAP